MVRDYEWAQAIPRPLGAAALAAALVLAGGGCVSYSGCRTQEDRVRARYEQHFILPNDPSSTAFRKNAKHVFFDFVTCCFHEIWRGNARRTYRRLILAEQRKEQEEAEARQREEERLVRLQTERQRKAQAERERIERQRRQDEAERELAKRREDERRRREEEKRVRDRALMLDAMRERPQGGSSDATIRQLKSIRLDQTDREADR